MPAVAEIRDKIAPIGAEWSIWILGLMTEVWGVAISVAILLWHDRFSMSWLGGGLIGAIIAILLVASGRVSRIGSPNEAIGVNITALILLYALTLYGFFAFPPLDALGGSAMVAIAVFCIVATGGIHFDLVLREKAARARFWSWFILLGFLSAYVYHAFQPLLGRR